MKKVIRLTESELHRIIKTSVNGILREYMEDNPLWDPEDDLDTQMSGDPDLMRNYDDDELDFEDEPGFEEEPSDFRNPYTDDELWDDPNDMDIHPIGSRI